MAYRLGVDVGGTFTDLLLVDENNDPKEVMDLDGTPIDEPHIPGVTNATT